MTCKLVFLAFVVAGGLLVLPACGKKSSDAGSPTQSGPPGYAGSKGPPGGLPPNGPPGPSSGGTTS